jgi:hypothetical protein
LVDPVAPRSPGQRGLRHDRQDGDRDERDTFSDGEGYFVRTEIEARCVSISGPFPDLQAAQALKAHRLANREKVSAALEEQLRRAISTLPAPAS